MAKPLPLVKTYLSHVIIPTYALQIMDFDYKKYNVKCGYCKGVVTFICSLIQTRDDDKPLT